MGLSDRTLSEDGVEMQSATNYLGHFLFTNLLMGKMVSSAAHGQTRIVNITSAGHVLAPIRFSDYNYEGRSVPPEEQPDVTIAAKMGMADVNPQSGYLPLFAYAQSNTGNMLFTVQLAESLREKGICSFSAAPGGMFVPSGYVMQSSPADSTQQWSKPNFNVICPKVSAIHTCSIRRQVKVQQLSVAAFDPGLTGVFPAPAPYVLR